MANHRNLETHLLSVVRNSMEPSVSSPARCERSLAGLIISNSILSRGEDRAPLPRVVHFSIRRAIISLAMKVYAFLSNKQEKCMNFFKVLRFHLKTQTCAIRNDTKCFFSEKLRLADVCCKCGIHWHRNSSVYGAILVVLDELSDENSVQTARS